MEQNAPIYDMLSDIQHGLYHKHSHIPHPSKSRAPRAQGGGRKMERCMTEVVMRGENKKH